MVADPWQGRGLGGRLMDALLEHAQKCGFERVEGDVLANNRPMLKLARRSGFAVLQSDVEPSVRRIVRTFGRALAAGSQPLRAHVADRARRCRRRRDSGQSPSRSAMRARVIPRHRTGSVCSNHGAMALRASRTQARRSGAFSRVVETRAPMHARSSNSSAIRGRSMRPFLPGARSRGVKYRGPLAVPGVAAGPAAGARGMAR